VAIGVLIEIIGCTREQYRAVAHDVGLLGPGATMPLGMVAHTGGEMPGGWRIFDVWRAVEPYESFARSRVGPACRRHGVPAFTPQVFDLENLQVPDPAGMAPTRPHGAEQ
jgi:hypothetical protein